MKIVGRFHFSVIDSTSSWLMRELEAALAAGRPFPLPALATAEIQTVGRGQKGRSWYSPKGCLKFTLAFRPGERGISIGRTPLLGFACALAVCKTAERFLTEAGISQRFAIHWPNDVYWEETPDCETPDRETLNRELPDRETPETERTSPRFRKLAGILLEGHVSGAMLAGIGVNLLNSMRDAPENLRDVLISLADLIPGPALNGTFPDSFLAELLDELDAQFDRLARAPLEIVRETDSRCSQKGTFVALQTPAGPVSGVCSGLAPDGGLIVGGKVFYSGTIH